MTDVIVEPSNVPAQDLPAKYVNQYYILTSGSHVRLALGEQVVAGGAANYHSTFILTTANAIELCQLTLKLIAGQGPVVGAGDDAGS